MWRSMILSLGVGTLAILVIFLVKSADANPPPAAQPAPAAAPAAQPAAPAKGEKAAGNRIVAVTVYPNSALVTREVELPQGVGVFELVVSPLPARTINSSLYAEGSDAVRVLTTRYRTRQLREDNREDVRKLEDELKLLQTAKEKLESDIRTVQTNLQLIANLEKPAASIPAPQQAAINSEAAIALSKYIMDTRGEKARELVGLQQQVQLNQEKAEFARRKLHELASGATRVEQDAVVVVNKVDAAAGKVRLNYLVDSASWRPQYKLRTGKAAKDQVHLEYQAALVQQTGEAWDNVKLALSTAEPLLNAAPADLQVLNVNIVPRGSTARPGMDLLTQARTMRTQAQKEFNVCNHIAGAGLVNSAAALDQSFELLNSNPLPSRKGGSLVAREGPSVTYHLNSLLSVPTRNDEQVVEVARIEMPPQYYYKAVPVLSSHVYRLADLTNRSNYVLLPGEATMYVGSDFVGRMNLPLVAVGEQFTAGFGVDPQLQVQRDLLDRIRTIQGGNQVLRFEFRILVNSYKSERVNLQVWDRLPHAENETAGISLVKSAPEISKDTLYAREQRPNNLLRWDVVVDPTMTGDKALAINYEFKLELDRQMTIGGFTTATGPRAPEPPPLPPLSSAEETKIRANLGKLSVDDRRIAEAQVFCATEEDSRLGAFGVPIKVMCKGQPVFVCCSGCEADAKANPDATLARVQKMIARVKAANSSR